jgi:hypothetical protein
MATLTRTTFQATSARQQTIQRVSNQIARRALAQVEAAQTQANAPALAASGGLVQRPGGEPLRPRANQGTGAVAVGSAVQYNQGIAMGQPLVGIGGPPTQGWNGQEAIGVVLEPPEEGREYEISAYEFYRSQVVQFAVSTEAHDLGLIATLVPGPGEVAEVGSSLLLTLDVVPDGLESVTISIELRRL